MLPSWTVTVPRQLVTLLALAIVFSTATPIASNDANVPSNQTGPVLQKRGNILCCMASDDLDSESDNPTDTTPLLGGSGAEGDSRYGAVCDSFEPVIDPGEELPTFPGVNDLALLLKSYGVVDDRQVSVFWDLSFDPSRIQIRNWLAIYGQKDQTFAIKNDTYPKGWYDGIQKAMDDAIEQSGLKGELSQDLAYIWLDELLDQAWATTLKGDVYHVSEHENPRMAIRNGDWWRFILPALTRNKNVAAIYESKGFGKPEKIWEQGGATTYAQPRGRKESLPPTVYMEWLRSIKHKHLKGAACEEGGANSNQKLDEIDYAFKNDPRYTDDDEYDPDADNVLNNQ